MSEQPTNPAPNRRWLRFSLRTLFVLMTVLCVWLAFRISSAMQQRDVIGRLARNFDQHSSHPALQVAYDYQWDANNQPTSTSRPPGPEWLQKLLGIDFFQTVIGLHLSGATNADLQDLQKLQSLRWLNLGGNFSDSDLNRLAAHQELTTLTLDLSYSPNVTDRGLAFLGELKNLTSLTLSVSNSVTAAGLKSLAQLTKLEELDLRFDGTQGEGVLAHVSKLPGLRILRVSVERGEKQVNAGLAHLSATGTLEEIHLRTDLSTSPTARIAPSNLGAIPSLKRLYLSNWTGPTLDHLANLNHLEKLFIWRSNDLAASGLTGLHALPRLRVVTLVQCDNVTLHGLNGNLSLRVLEIDSCAAISSKGLSDLDGLPNLRQLELVHSPGISLKGLKGCPGLEELSVNMCDTSGDDLPHLAGLLNLRKLALNGSSILSLQRFPTIPRLEELEIERCASLQDSDVASLVSSLNVSPSLKKLRLASGDAMTDASLASLGQLIQLEILTLWIGPAMTDNGISQLANLVNLRRLELSTSSQSKVSVTSIGQLRKALPKCEIEYNQ